MSSKLKLEEIAPMIKRFGKMINFSLSGAQKLDLNETLQKHLDHEVKTTKRAFVMNQIYCWTCSLTLADEGVIKNYTLPETTKPPTRVPALVLLSTQTVGSLALKQYVGETFTLSGPQPAGIRILSLPDFVALWNDNQLNIADWWIGECWLVK